MSFGLSPSAQLCTIMCFVPLSERSGIDLNNSGFGKGIGADEFVVGRVEDDEDNTDFASNPL